MTPRAPATHVAQSTLEARLQSATAELAPVETELWTLAVIAAGLDVVFTYRGLQVGLTEGNPIVAALVGIAGIGALVTLKAAVFVVATLCRWCRPRWGPWLPLALVVPWLCAAAINATWLVVW